MGWSVGRGCPLPTEERVWGGGCAPSPEIFFRFFWFNVFKKNFAFRPKGGGIAQCPPLNTPLFISMICRSIISSVIFHAFPITAYMYDMLSFAPRIQEFASLSNCSGVVSGTAVRALVLGRFSQKK